MHSNVQLPKNLCEAILSDIIVFNAPIRAESFLASLPSPQDVDNIIESAFAFLIAENILSESLAESIIPKKIYRTAETYAFQQFSTPPLVSKRLFEMLSPDKNPKTMLEPSAGTGMLVAQGIKRGLKVTANDIDGSRISALKLFFKDKLTYKQCNAELIGNIIKEKFDVVAMNPPFSASLHRKRNDSKTSLIHYEQALSRLNPDGELIAVCPESSKVEVWARKKENEGYKVVLNHHNGEEYKKMGTTYPFITLKLSR